jgi:2-polyprenyl-3-methyl-5-hydroxy-6-metoxy-1,4-benzoquinol methylase
MEARQVGTATKVHVSENRTVSSLSEYNRERYKALKVDLRESRLRKVARWILEKPAGTLLDIGCGDGAMAARFRSVGFSVYGIDASKSQVAAALAKGIDARVQDLAAESLPFQNEFFDVIFAGEVIEHLVDTTAFLRETWRVLKYGGTLIVTTPNLASFENRLRLLLGIYPIWVEYKLEGGQGHVRAYTPRTLKSHLRSVGFHVTRHTGNWVPFIPQRFADDVRHPFLALTGALFPGLAMDIIVEAVKSEGRP